MNNASLPTAEDRTRADASPENLVVARAERLLTAMHNVFSHDLPNQLVVVQSLLGLLREETCLSAEGQDLLARLGNAARRAGDMVYFLKDMARLARLVEPIEEIRLPALAREAHAELSHALPQRELALSTGLDVGAVRAGRRSLYQALVQVWRAGAEHYSNRALLLTLTARPAEGGTEVGIGIEPGEGPLLSGAAVPRQDRTAPEQRLGIILAREYLALWGGTLAARPEAGRSFQFSLGIPARPEHD